MRTGLKTSGEKKQTLLLLLLYICDFTFIWHEFPINFQMQYIELQPDFQLNEKCDHISFTTLLQDLSYEKKISLASQWCNHFLVLHIFANNTFQEWTTGRVKFHKEISDGTLWEVIKNRNHFHWARHGCIIFAKIRLNIPLVLWFCHIVFYFFNLRKYTYKRFCY